MQTMNISQSDEPLNKHNFASQHRLWLIQHCALAIMAALMVAVLLGTLNLGPFSKASIDTNSELPLNVNSSVRVTLQLISTILYFRLSLPPMRPICSVNCYKYCEIFSSLYR